MLNWRPAGCTLIDDVRGYFWTALRRMHSPPWLTSHQRLFFFSLSRLENSAPHWITRNTTPSVFLQTRHSVVYFIAFWNALRWRISPTCMCHFSPVFHLNCHIPRRNSMTFAKRRKQKQQPNAERNRAGRSDTCSMLSRTALHFAGAPARPKIAKHEEDRLNCKRDERVKC